MSDCPMLPGDPPRTCHWCASDLPRRKDGKPHRNRRWCSRKCERAWQDEHVWGFARHAARERDGRRCVRCGGNGSEVNHIEPRRGEGYHAGCHHHLDNLETLCHGCHVEVTTAQRRGWEGSALELPNEPEQLHLVREAS